MPRNPLLPLVPTLAVLFAAACESVPQAETATVVRDSAGIVIVENGGPAWSAGEGWTVSPEPILSIGAVDGGEELIFTAVRAAVRLGDGRVAVSDAASNSVRYFGADGSHLLTTGRRGEGPEEFAGLGQIFAIAGDTLLAADFPPRVVVLAPDGRFVRSVPIAAREGGSFVSPVGALEDGTLIGVSGSRGFGPADAGKVIQDTLQLFRVLPDGTVADRVVALPGAARWGLQVGGSTTFPYVPFAGNPSWAAGSGRIAAARASRPEVLVFGADGSLERLTRWQAARQAVQTSELTRFRAWWLGTDPTPLQRLQVDQLLAEAPLPDSLPVTSAAHIDALGHLWVERYRTPWETQPPQWDVFDPEGVWLGAVQTPRRFVVSRIDTDRLIGTWRDDLDVPHVRMYAVEGRGR